jgi:hypothetical protein
MVPSFEIVSVSRFEFDWLVQAERVQRDRLARECVRRDLVGADNRLWAQDYLE